jgi:hypothetical protein
MMIPRRLFVLFGIVVLGILLTGSFLMRNGIEEAPNFVQDLHDKIEPPVYTGPKYKSTNAPKATPIVDNFPLAANARSVADLPPIPKWNKPPVPHFAERTPLFIGFTRNWRLLQQVVVSYITAGWPPADIYVVENTGVLDANKLGQLSLQNPFFLNHTRLEMLGVNVLITPTLFTFAQLQNFYHYTSTVEKYPFFFWSHMDVVAIPFEWTYQEQHPEIDVSKPDMEYKDFNSIYFQCITALHEVLNAKDEKTGEPLRWAMRFFSYDRLALVNVTAFREIGGWDTQIPFYMTDCDMHARLEMANFNIEERPSGLVYDVASSLDDLIVLYRKRSGPNGAKIPAAKFIDPNVIEAELKAIADAEEELKKSGWGLDDDFFPHSPKETPSNRRYIFQHNEEVQEQKAESKRDPAPLQGYDPYASVKALENAATAITPSGVWEDDTLDSDLFKALTSTLDHMQGSKSSGNRNNWQARQTGGQGDPFYRDSRGFEHAIQMTIEHGRHIFREKWGHRDCDIVAMGLKPEDAWKVEHDWRDE